MDRPGRALVCRLGSPGKIEELHAPIAGRDDGPAARDSRGGDDNRHEKSDQWLYVVSGEGQALVKGRKVTLQTGSVLLIEAVHEIKNSGAQPLVTINVYAPPAY